MNRTLAAVSLALLTAAAATGAHAQGMTAPKPTFGVLAGINVATLGGSDAQNAGSRTGLAIGGSATFHITNQFGIEPELLFSQKGASETINATQATLKLDYIEIPVLARYDVSTRGPAHPFFLAGPALAFEVSCNAEVSNGGQSASESCDNLNQQLEGGLSKKSFDFGGQLGAGVVFPAGKKMNLSVSVRYTLGFVDTFDNADAKNRNWSFLAGLTF